MRVGAAKRIAVHGSGLLAITLGMVLLAHISRNPVVLFVSGMGAGALLTMVLVEALSST